MLFPFSSNVRFANITKFSIPVRTGLDFSYICYVKGIIFSIEEFAINDGPGIRTTVFLKGCPLRCAWCHNPEGLSAQPQIIHRLDRDELCGKEIESDVLAMKLLADREIFALNGGGVTFTGGEPTMQPDFLCDVLERLDTVHTAVETSGYCSPAVFAKVVERTDLILFDIKHSDPQRHRQFTGEDNAPILRNLESLIRSGRRFVARIPLIPGINDSLENMCRIAALLQNAPALERVELLRYHKTAGAKYPMLDMAYNPPFDVLAEPAVHEVFENIETKVL